MPNEVTIHVKAKNDAKSVIADVRKDVQGLGKESVAAARDVDKLGDATAKTARKQTEMATVTKKVTRELDDQGDKVDVVQRKLRLLSLGKYQVELDIDRDGRLSRALSKAGAGFSSLSDKAGDAAKAVGNKFADLLPDALGKAFTSAGPVVQTAIFALATTIGLALAAVIGTALIGGILAALGGGIIAAGVLAALKNSKIDEILNGKVTGPTSTKATDALRAGMDAVDRARGVYVPPGGRNQITGAEGGERTGGIASKAKDVLGKFSAPFVEPLVRALNQVSAALDKISPKAEELGKKFAPVVDKLMPALVLMGEKAWPGIAAALDASLPLFDDLAEALPDIGAALGSIFQIIADHKDEARDGFQILLDVVIFLLATVAGLVAAILGAFEAGKKIKNFFGDAGDWGKDAFGGLLVRLSAIASALQQAIGLADRLNGSITGSARRLDGGGGDGGSVPGGGGLGNKPGRASGGIAGGLTRVAELGGELLKLPQGSMVYASGQSQQMLANAAGGSQKVDVEIRFTGGGRRWADFMEAQRTGEVQILSTAIVGGKGRR